MDIPHWVGLVIVCVIGFILIYLLATGWLQQALGNVFSLPGHQYLAP